MVLYSIHTVYKVAFASKQTRLDILAEITMYEVSSFSSSLCPEETKFRTAGPLTTDILSYFLTKYIHCGIICKLTNFFLAIFLFYFYFLLLDVCLCHYYIQKIGLC